VFIRSWLLCSITGYHARKVIWGLWKWHLSVIILSRTVSVVIFVGLALWKPNAELIWVTVRPEGGSNERQCISRYCSVPAPAYVTVPTFCRRYRQGLNIWILHPVALCNLVCSYTVNATIEYSQNYATEHYKINRQHTPTIDNQHSKEEEA
jgi:hypothetical protein